MTVAEAIGWLTRIQERHGPEVKVYFDCPKCNQAFTPSSENLIISPEPPLTAPTAPGLIDDATPCKYCGEIGGKHS